MNHLYHPEFHDPQLRLLGSAGLSDQAIADQMGFSKSLIQQRRLFLGLRANGSHAKAAPEQSLRAIPDYNPVAAAVGYLGAEDRGEKGYFWKGRPMSAKDLVIEANRLRKERGQDQIGPPAWRIP